MSINEQSHLAYSSPPDGVLRPRVNALPELARIFNGWPLLYTKLLRPQLPYSWVGREALLDLMADHDGHWCVQASAGYGKTMLASALCQQQHRRSAWLTLDSGDNDPVRFAMHLVAAFVNLCPDIMHTVRPAHNDGRTLTPGEAVALLLNHSLLQGERLLLVMDDVHAIQEPSVLDALTMLLEQADQQLQVVLVSRNRIGLRLAALRMQGRLRTLETHHLAFSAADCIAYLQKVGHHPAGAALEPLLAHLEGWPAGLRGLALFLENGPAGELPAPEQLVNSGLITEYLWEQVFSLLPRPLQEFVQCSALLGTFNAELCRALPGGSHNETLLQEVVERQLFINRLEGAGCWYRYHALFQNWLVSRSRREEAQQESEIHTCAARFWLQQGDFSRALDHAVNARTPALLVDVLDAAPDVPGLLHGTLVPMAIRLLHNEDLCRRRKVLMLACRYWLQHDPERVLQLVECATALASGTAHTLAAHDVDHVLAIVDLYRAQVCFGREQLDVGVTHAERALARMPPDDYRSHGEVRALQAEALMRRGLLQQSTDTWLEAERFARRAGAAPLAGWAMHQLAQIDWLQGRVDEARQLQDSAIQWLDQQGVTRASSLWCLLRARAELAWELFQLDDCDDYCQQALEVCRYWTRDGTLTVHLLRARLACLRGQMQSALEQLERARGLARTTHHHSHDLALLAVVDAEIGLKSALSGRVQGHRTPDAAPPLNETDLRFGRADALRCMATGDFERAGELLQQLAAHAGALGFHLEHWQCSLWRLACLEQQGEHDPRLWQSIVQFAASRQLVSSLLLAAPWLRQALASTEGLDQASLHFVRRLRELCTRGRAGGGRFAPPPAPMTSLTLTSRDWAVLQLLLAGASNDAVADQLHLALGTVKNIITRIYRKLNVSDREQACEVGRRILNEHH